MKAFNSIDDKNCFSLTLSATILKSTLKSCSSTNFNKEFLKNQEGQYKGYPFRTFVGHNFQNGYSDHFPVYVFIVREKN